MNTKNKPVHDIRLGAIKAAIWANQTPKGTRYSVTLTRLYKDGEQWKRSESFGRDDLPLIEKVVNQAYLWICSTIQAAPTAEPEPVADVPVEVNI
jgi:hypothetical protein